MGVTDVHNGHEFYTILE